MTYADVTTIEPVISVVCVDDTFNPIEETATEFPEFLGELVLNNTEKAPVVVEGYDYVQARIGGTVVESISKEIADSTAAEPSYKWSYTAEGVTTPIELDTTVILEFAEIPVAAELNATIVDEFGDEIDEKYTEMKLPEFGAEGILVLDDEENPPVEKVSVRQSLFKVTKYTYVKASFDDKIIKALKQEPARDGEGFCYSYTTDGETWTNIKEDSTVIFEYTDGKKTVFTYEDAYVTVTATLQHAGAIPDDAELIVTPITAKSSNYNYDAYMEALNSGAEEEENAKYSDENTLLYDIAFFSVDEDGNKIEVEPTEGSVNINMQFKAKQLEKEIEAVAEEDIEVVHMPLSESAKAASDSTAEATGISAADIIVEEVPASVSVSGEVIDFSVSEFSCYAVYNNGLQRYEFRPGTSRDYKSILGDAVLYGLTANTVSHNSHMDVNFATGTLTGSANVTAGVYTGSHYPGNYIIGEYTGSGFFTDNGSYRNPFVVYTTADAAAKFGEQLWANNPQILVDTDHSAAELKSEVTRLVSGTASAALAAEPDVTTYTEWSSMIKNGKTASGWLDAIESSQKYYLDLSASPAGTYYFAFKDGEYAAKLGEAAKLNISMNSDQNIVFNIPDSSVNIQKFMISINGNQVGSDVNSNVADPYCRAITWNLPNAKTVICNNMLGIVLAPVADVTIGGTSTGWLVCNKLAGNNGEWHGVWQDMPPTVIPTGLNISASKTVDGKTPAKGEIFRFTLTQTDANGKEMGDPIQVKESSETGAIAFDSVEFKKAGTY